MRNIAHRTPPCYSNTIQGRADYDDCAYKGEPEADIIARRQYLNKLLDALRVLLRAARRARPIKAAATTTPNPTGRNNGGNT